MAIHPNPSLHRRKLMMPSPPLDPIKLNSSTCKSSCLSICREPCVDLHLIPPPNPPAPATPPPPFNGKPHHDNSHLLLITLLSVAATACFVFFFCTIYKKHRDRMRRRRRTSTPEQPLQHDHDIVAFDLDGFLDENHGPVLDHPIWYIRTVGLQPSIISAITVCKYKRGDGLVEGTECSVCLSEFQEDETLRLLPKCNHAFHIPCIDTWLRSHTNCPMCRAGIVTNPAGLPAEQGVVGGDSSVVGEESTPVVIPERSGSGESMRMETEEGEGELRVHQSGGNGQETWKEDLDAVEEEVQPMRRSVSMDSVAASMISAAIAAGKNGENRGIRKADVNASLLRLAASSSIGRCSSQKGPTSMKRSTSCGGTTLLSRYSRNRNSLNLSS